MRVPSLGAVLWAAATGFAVASPAPDTDGTLVKRLDCQSGFLSCAPAGATASTLPPLGTALASLYQDLLNSAKDAPPPSFGKRDEESALERRDGASMCCKSHHDLLGRSAWASEATSVSRRDWCIWRLIADPGASGSACVNLRNYNVPMCYDKFTTNFLLPDGSFGTLDSGVFRAADGGSAFLGNGSFSTGGGGGGGAKGNLYGDPARAPNTATLPPIPTPYTGTGVGSAIPVTALGGRATYTVTLPGTTVAPSTVAGSVVSGTTRPPSTTTVTSVAAAGSGASSTGGAPPAPAPTKLAAAAAGAAGAFALVLAAL